MRRVQLSRQHHEAGDEKASPAVWFSELTGDIEIRTKASNDAKLTRFFRLWTWSVHRRYGDGLRIFFPENSNACPLTRSRTCVRRCCLSNRTKRCADAVEAARSSKPGPLSAGLHGFLPVRQRWLDKVTSGTTSVLCMGQLCGAVREQSGQPSDDPAQCGRERERAGQCGSAQAGCLLLVVHGFRGRRESGFAAD